MNINLTLIGQTITFFLFVWFCYKFVWPPLVNALAERKKEIADGLAAAERGKHKQALAEKRSAKVLYEAKGQASEIIGRAEKRAGEIVEEAKGDAKLEGERILITARGEIDQEVNRAKDQLRQQVAVLVVAGAEQILKREIDAEAHSQVIDELVTQL